MTDSSTRFLKARLPGAGRLRRGLAISIALWIFFLIATAYTSYATLLDRVASTDVMKAASEGAWSGRIAWEIAAFLAVVTLLHVAFAILCWLLACATAVFSDTARQKFGRIVVGWFSALAGAVLIFNALWYPRTLIGAYYHDLVSFEVAGLPIGRLIYGGIFSLAVFVLLRAAFVVLRHARPAIRRHAGLAMLVGGTALAAYLLLPSGKMATAASADARPNVIVLGLDSLRLEQLQRFGGAGMTPHLDDFLAQSDLFVDTTTPLARTFSSWMAILTGRSPVQTGARFNLAERSSIAVKPTVADLLREAGYRTVYSTDEVRFANFDESYGFDEVITPRIGASDFLIGTYNELPLSSIFINTAVGQWLFPFSYANRGVATMFQPDTYVERLRSRLQFDEPTFLIVHLTAAHWPYYTSDTPFGMSQKKTPDDRPMYRIGLQTADRMFGEVIDVLRDKGALENALVIVLSDHGEAMGLPSDSFFDESFRVEGMGSPLKMLDYGHGQSVLSKSQYQILLSFRDFGPRATMGTRRDLAFPATAEDIAPTMLEYLGIPAAKLNPVGRSLMPILRGTETQDAAVTARVRFTETDLSVLPSPGGGVDEIATARQNSKFFMVDPATARLHINPGFAPLAKAYKERAAFTQDQLLGAMPAGPYAHQYVFLDFANHRGKLLLGRPADDAVVEQKLWDALVSHYGDELKPAVRIRIEDWPRIEVEWEDFSTALKLGKPAPRTPDEARALATLH